MDQQAATTQDQSDKYLAAVAAAGQAVIAVRSGMGVAKIGLRKMDDGDEETYQGFCEPRRFRGPLSTLRFLVSGEAAQVATGLCEFPEVSVVSTHRAAANVVRGWQAYWEAYPYFYSNTDDWLVDEVAEESTHLIALVRWQMRRRWRYEPDKSAVELLALRIRDSEALTGEEAERLVREKCRTEKAKTESEIPILR